MANNLSGISYTNNFNNLDGLSIVQADELFVDGTSIDPTNLVPYTGATQTTDLGSQNIKTSRVPTANSDLTNKFYVDGAITTGGTGTLAIVNLNFVKYTGSISDTDLGTYKISSSAVPTTGINLTNKTYVDTQDALRVPYTGATSNVVLTGTNQFQQAYNATISDTTTVVNRQTLDSAIASLGAGILNLDNTWGYSNTNNLNGGIKTIQNPLQYNSSLDANSYFVVGVSPTTYIFSGNWIINPVSGTTANISLDSALFYFSTSIKYVITFTGIYGTSGSWVGTVFNNTTTTTVSDASIAITTSSQTLSMTFTPGSNNPTIYLRFVGASGTLRWTNFTIKEVDTQVMGNLIIDSQINSNIVQTNGKTSNLSNGLKVNQTSIATASSLTTASLPAGVSASTLSGSYTLTATAGGSTFGMWLGSSFTYTAGAKYTYTFTGLSTNATALQAMIMYNNSYSGGSGTMIGDYVVNVPITSSTVSGSFTATSNNNVVWNFVASATGKSISFTGFTLTRADTEITGTATINSSTTITGTASISGVITATGIATGTPATTIGLNSSNQLIKYTNPVSSVFTGSVSSTYIPYASSANVFANSIMYQSGTQINIGGTLYATDSITSAGDMTCGLISPSSGYGRLDDRSLRPKDINAGTEQFFFASWNNDGGSPYADAIGMNGWTDSSGGNTNVLMVRKDTYGIRQYQGTFGSTTAFVNSPAGSAQYMDCCMKGVGDNTMTEFTATGGTYNQTLWVGSGTDKGTAQVITTNGDLCLDPKAGKAIYLGVFRNPTYIYGYASSGMTNFTRYWTQYADVNGDVSMYLANQNGGSSSYFNLIIHESGGNTNHFMNSASRSADGGENCYTIRNDTGGGVRFMGTNGGFSSYVATGTGGATYTNAIVNYQNGAGTGNITTWNGYGFTLFCNTTQPSGSQPAYGIVSNNYNTNFIVSLSPSVRWMDIQVWGAVHYHYCYGNLVVYLSTGGNWVYVSDAREKEDINDLKTSRSLERIMSCKPKYYKRKYYDKDKDGKDTTPTPQSIKDTICIGLLAQDVLQHNPHCVSGWKNDNIKETDDDDGSRYGINYNDFTVHLIGAVQEIVKQSTSSASQIQEQQKMIDAQQKQIEALHEKLEALMKLTEERFDKVATLLSK